MVKTNRTFWEKNQWWIILLIVSVIVIVIILSLTLTLTDTNENSRESVTIHDVSLDFVSVVSPEASRGIIQPDTMSMAALSKCVYVVYRVKRPDEVQLAFSQDRGETWNVVAVDDDGKASEKRNKIAIALQPSDVLCGKPFLLYYSGPKSSLVVASPVPPANPIDPLRDWEIYPVEGGPRNPFESSSPYAFSITAQALSTKLYVAYTYVVKRPLFPSTSTYGVTLVSSEDQGKQWDTVRDVPLASAGGSIAIKPSGKDKAVILAYTSSDDGAIRVVSIGENGDVSDLFVSGPADGPVDSTYPLLLELAPTGELVLGAFFENGAKLRLWRSNHTDWMQASPLPAKTLTDNVSLVVDQTNIILTGHGSKGTVIAQTPQAFNSKSQWVFNRIKRSAGKRIKTVCTTGDTPAGILYVGALCNQTIDVGSVDT